MLVLFASSKKFERGFWRIRLAGGWDTMKRQAFSGFMVE